MAVLRKPSSELAEFQKLFGGQYFSDGQLVGELYSSKLRLSGLKVGQLGLNVSVVHNVAVDRDVQSALGFLKPMSCGLFGRLALLVDPPHGLDLLRRKPKLLDQVRPPAFDWWRLEPIALANNFRPRVLGKNSDRDAQQRAEQNENSGGE